MRQLLLPSLQEVLIPEMKWRKVCPASGSLSLPANIPCVPRASMDSTDSFFPSRKPPGSGEFKGLDNSNCVQRLGFPSSYFCKQGSSQPAGLLRAVSFFLQTDKGKPSSFGEYGEVGMPCVGLGSCLPREDAQLLSYCREGCL